MISRHCLTFTEELAFTRLPDCGTIPSWGSGVIRKECHWRVLSCGRKQLCFWVSSWRSGPFRAQGRRPEEFESALEFPLGLELESGLPILPIPLTHTITLPIRIRITIPGQYTMFTRPPSTWRRRPMHRELRSISNLGQPLRSTTIHHRLLLPRHQRARRRLCRLRCPRRPRLQPLLSLVEPGIRTCSRTTPSFRRRADFSPPQRSEFRPTGVSVSAARLRTRPALNPVLF